MTQEKANQPVRRTGKPGRSGLKTNGKPGAAGSRP